MSRLWEDKNKSRPKAAFKDSKTENQFLNYYFFIASAALPAASLAESAALPAASLAASAALPAASLTASAAIAPPPDAAPIAELAESMAEVAAAEAALSTA